VPAIPISKSSSVLIPTMRTSLWLQYLHCADGEYLWRTELQRSLSNKRDRALIQSQIHRVTFNIKRAQRRLQYHISYYRELKREYRRLVTRSGQAHNRAVHKFKVKKHRSGIGLGISLSAGTCNQEPSGDNERNFVDPAISKKSE
jgi:hypothetical protein